MKRKEKKRGKVQILLKTKSLRTCQFTNFESVMN